ncbi:hypothetical protein WA026_002013 [Henosepilachna vigintioctopunctata]|uniref:TTF-type domain-containing protein n=1 Tax=Henosepilachna vigintioctopunctata TaxID=420089 RepID=A0AAW1UV03_9CUCU
MEDIVIHLKKLKLQNINFLTMPLNEQLIIKRGRSKPDLDLKQTDVGVIRRFNRKWYETYPWLTGSPSMNKIFCLVCVIYGGEISWSQDGISVIKNFVNKAEKHQCSKRHIKNMECFVMLGKSPIIRGKEKLAAVVAEKQREEEMKKRELISKILDIILFLIRRQNNYGKFQMNILVPLQLLIRKYAKDDSIFQETFEGMQTQLISCMETVLLDSIIKEINETDFCSLQTDEVPNDPGTYSVIVRYTHNGIIQERFVGFSRIQTTLDLAAIINRIIGDARKLVCITCDGSISMNPVRQGIKRIIPRIIFLHNYMHKLNTILLQGLQNFEECRFFTNRVTFICDFFRDPKRNDMLKKEGVILPSRRETLWMFNSKAVIVIKMNHAIISKIVNDIIENQSCLDLEVQHAASTVRRYLKDYHFVLLFCLFNKVFLYANHLSKIIHTKIDQHVDNCIQEIAQTVKNISNFKTDIVIKHWVDEAKALLKVESIPATTIQEFKKTAFLIIDSVIEQIEERFRDTKFLKFVEILDGSRFISYKSKFPKLIFQELVKNWPDLFHSHRLENELSMIYGDSLKRFNPYQLFSYLYDNDLTELYIETYKLVRLYLTYPLIPIDPEESCSTLTKVRNYLNSTNGRKQAKSDILFIENYFNITNAISSFKQKVIDNFHFQC